MDQRVLKTILENHILKLKVSLSELYNGQELETLGGKLLRVFIYRTVELRRFVCLGFVVFTEDSCLETLWSLIVEPTAC